MYLLVRPASRPKMTAAARCVQSAVTQGTKCAPWACWSSSATAALKERIAWRCQKGSLELAKTYTVLRMFVLKSFC